MNESGKAKVFGENIRQSPSLDQNVGLQKAVDYDRLKDLIKKYTLILSKMISLNRPSFPLHCEYVFGNIIDFLEGISACLNGQEEDELRIRKKPIL